MFGTKFNPGDFVIGCDTSYPRSIYEVIDSSYTKVLLSFRVLNHAKFAQVKREDCRRNPLVMEPVPYLEKSPGVVQLWSVSAGFHRLATRDEIIEQGLNPDWSDRNFGKIHKLFIEGKVHIVPNVFSDAEERILTRILRNSLSGRSDFQVWRLNSLNPTNLLYIYKYLSQNIPPEIPYIAGEIKSLLISKGYTTDYRESCERAVKAMAAKYDKSPNPDCQRCKDWDSMGLSNTCPSCDAQALAAIEDFKCEICRDIQFITVGEEDYIIQACKCNTKYKPLLSGWAD